ncbi:MAG: hypothetical protein HOP23_00485 [Methylococcaceae bacterium]|nr:hypothetical protein [Methylococcaceae bacterium]
MFIIIAQFIWSRTRPPEIDKTLHLFSAKAKGFGQEQYEKVLRLNRNFEDKKILEEYASLVRDAVQSFEMYIDTSGISDLQELNRQAKYWMIFTEHYKNRYEKLERRYNFIAEDKHKN